MPDVDDGAFGEAARSTPVHRADTPQPARDIDPAGPCGRAGAPGSRRTIARTVEREIVPRLIASARLGESEADLAEETRRLVAALCEGDFAGARAVLRDAHAAGISVRLIETCILAPAARRLGEMWEADTCDFATVCLGVTALQRLMHEARDHLPDEPARAPRGARILLASAPGEHHVFGIDMVAERFVVAGWEVVCRPSAPLAELVRIVAGEWFDTVGFSLSAERNAGALANAIRAVRRASLNPAPRVLVGGAAVEVAPVAIGAVGADRVVADAAAAIEWLSQVAGE